ncbi:MAG TPA: DUF882 domain-containing protein [Polyangia bacterium]
MGWFAARSILVVAVLSTAVPAGAWAAPSPGRRHAVQASKKADDKKAVVERAIEKAPSRSQGDRGRKAPAASSASRNGPVELYAVNGKEVLYLRLRDDRGRPLKGVQRRFDHFLRCHHTNVQHAMNPRLVRLLYQVGRHYPGRRLEVVSGYRHPTVAKNPRSPHMQGLACDFRIAGVRNQDLRDYLRRSYEKVGVGYYPNSSFVHLDVRKDRSAFWIDYAGPGERAMYSDDPVADLKTGRADAFKPTTIDRSWANDADVVARAGEGLGPVGGDGDGDTDRAPRPGQASPMEVSENEAEALAGESLEGAETAEARGEPGGPGQTAAAPRVAAAGTPGSPSDGSEEARAGAAKAAGGANARVNVSTGRSVSRQ